MPEMGLYVATAALPASRLAITWRPDVIHCHFAMPTGPVAWAASRAARVPYVLTAHLGDVPGGVPAQTDRLFRVVGPAARRIWRDAAAATAVSSFVRDLAVRAYGREVERIPNGIVPGPEPDCRPGDPVRLVFAGRFNPQKNLPFLAGALARLPRDLRWTLDLVGDGPDRAEVARRLGGAGLSDRVRFHGWQTPEETARLLRAADVLVIPSLSEGMPVVGVQALDAGLALAGSDIPGLADVLEDGANGFAVPPTDEARYAAELGRLIADPDRLEAMRRTSRRRAARFDWGGIVEAYERVLGAAAGKPGDAHAAGGLSR